MRGSMECATLNVHAYKLSCKSFLCKPKKKFHVAKTCCKECLDRCAKTDDDSKKQTAKKDETKHNIKFDRLSWFYFWHHAR